jgi:type VI secretion system secreted protein VgrG
MWRLELNFQSRVFQNMNIEQMITEVLETAEFAGEDFEFKLNETYPDIEFAVQYRETDFNFVNRRLEHFGIFYYFEHRDDNDVIVFTDVNDNLPAIETEDDISYNPNKDPLSEKETISRFTYQGQVVTGKTQLKDYNYQTPSKELSIPIIRESILIMVTILKMKVKVNSRHVSAMKRLLAGVRFIRETATAGPFMPGINSP